MEYRRLGRTDLRVSAICLGTMTYGQQNTEAEGFEQMDYALEQGINFFDTANSYSDGTSEEIVGRALRDFARRDEIVLATKVYFPLAFSERGQKTPNASGLSRKAIFQGIDASLRRLGIDGRRAGAGRLLASWPELP